MNGNEYQIYLQGFYLTKLNSSRKREKIQTPQSMILNKFSEDSKLHVKANQIREGIAAIALI